MWRSRLAPLRLSRFICKSCIFMPLCNSQFKPSKDLVSLLVCNEKILSFGFRFFCGWRHEWDRFRCSWPRLSGPRLQLKEESVSLKFSVETRPKSKSLEPLTSFLRFLLQKSNLGKKYPERLFYPNIGYFALVCTFLNGCNFLTRINRSYFLCKYLITHCLK